MPRLLIVAALALLVAGCDGGMGDLKIYVAEVKARKSSDIEAMPVVRSYDPFAYDAAGRRAPFTPLVTSRDEDKRQNASGLAPDLDRRREPLEAFPLDALRMAGTLRYAGTRYALIKAPDGVVYRVNAGDHMGQNYGKVIAVGMTGVELVEIVPDGIGGFMQRAASVALTE